MGLKPFWLKLACSSLLLARWWRLQGVPGQSMSKPEIEVTAMSKDDAESKFGISKWGTWGCGVSKFDWEYSGKETAYILEGEVTVTPTGDWAKCETKTVKAGDLVVFPDGMTCVWDVTKAINKHYNFS